MNPLLNLKNILKKGKNENFTRLLSVGLPKDVYYHLIPETAAHGTLTSVSGIEYESSYLLLKLLPLKEIDHQKM